MNNVREYKFRGKRVDNGEWVYGCYTYSKKAERHLIWIQSEDNTEFWHTYPFEVYPSTVGQYTGLKDKNGKEIYEGDIIRHHGDILSEIFYNSLHCAYLLKDVSGNRNKCRCDKLGDYSSLWVEVIGNIYENPELLRREAYEWHV